jgi:hypothetical protein
MFFAYRISERKLPLSRGSGQLRRKLTTPGTADGLCSHGPCMDEGLPNPGVGSCLIGVPTHGTGCVDTGSSYG